MDANENVSMGESIRSVCAEMSLPDLNLSSGDKSVVVIEECGETYDQCGEEIDHEGEPEIGMMFDTTKEAYDFYNTYAKRVGFSVRILRTNKNKSDNNIIQRQALVCSCEGTYKKIKTPQRRRDIRRCDCKASLVINRIPGDKYRVINFKSEHSHDLVPLERSRYLRPQRKIDFAQAEIIDKMHSSGLKQGQIFSCMCDEAGGVQNLSSGDKSVVVIEECGETYDQCGEEIDHEGEPKIGMRFDTTKEAYDFYNTYAKRVGFSVRILRTNKNKSDNNIIQRQALVCSCEGTYKKIKTPQRRRDIRRCDCKALLVINRIPSDKYRVIDFKSEHSHDLVPLEHSRYLRSQRKIDFAQAEIIDKMHSSRLKQGQIFSYTCDEAGGVQNLNCTRSGCNNLLKQGQIFSYTCDEAGGVQNLNCTRSGCNNLLQRRWAEFLKKGNASCTGRNFEFDGILYSHALKLFRHLEYKSLTPRYYLKRWTRSTIYEDICDPMEEIIPNDNDPMLIARYSELSHITQRIVSAGSRHVDVFNKCKSLLLELEGKIEACLGSEVDVNKCISIDAHDNPVANLQKECQMQDLTKRHSKGQSSKRIKGPLETKARKKSSPTLTAKELNSDHIMESVSTMSQMIS